MPGLSCRFCIFSLRSTPLLAGKHNLEVLAEYVEGERQIEHRFRLGLPLGEVQAAPANGEERGPVHDGVM